MARSGPSSAFRALLRTLPDDIDEARERGLPVELRIRHEPAAHALELLAVLGVPWVLDERAPRCLLPCHRKECRVSDRPHPIVHARNLGEAIPVSTRSTRDPLDRVAVSGGRKIGDMDADHQAWLDKQTTVQRCLACTWTFTGPAIEGRAAAAAHREKEHAELVNGSRTKRLKAQQVEAEAVAAARAQRRALDAMDAGDTQEPFVPATDEETGPAEEAQESGGSQPLGGGSVPAGVPGAEVGGASNRYGLKKLGRGYEWTRDKALAAIQDYATANGRPPTSHLQASASMPSPATLCRLFGTFADAIEAAGFARPKRGGDSASHAARIQKLSPAKAPAAPRAPAPPASAPDPEPVVEPEPEPEPIAPVLVLIDEAPPELDPPLAPMAIVGNAVDAAARAGVRLTPRIKAALAELLHAIGDELLEGPDA